ncbi:MAG: hypothetical protein ACYDGZ_21820 [Desulfosporosinus fructosivorans]
MFVFRQKYSDLLMGTEFDTVDISMFETKLVRNFCILHAQPEGHKHDIALDLVQGLQGLE